MMYTRRPSDQRCEEIYAYITEYVAENGHSPTFREVGEAVGLRSSSTVSRYIHRLVDEGRITIDESKPRTLTAAASGDALEPFGSASVWKWPTAARFIWTAIWKSRAPRPSAYPSRAYWTRSG